MPAPRMLAYEHNGQPVARERFYAIACDPRRSVAVEACAGAGKTWMLVSRILRALLEGTASDGRRAAQPHEILAITFTKKAAGEMRQRLREWLAHFAQAGDEELDQALLQRGVAPGQLPALRVALRGLYPALLESGRPVQIRTFHSWFAALLRTAPLAVLEQLQLPANYELLEDDSQAVDLVWRRFHAAVAAEPAAREDFRASVAAHGRSQTHKALLAALSKRVEFMLADQAGTVAGSIQPFAVQFPEFAGLAEPQDALQAGTRHHTTLCEAVPLLLRGANATQRKQGAALESAVREPAVAGVLSALLTQSGTPRKHMGEQAAVQAAQALAVRLAAACEQHEAWLHQQRMARLTRLLIAEFGTLKRQRGWVDMNDVERAALVMLGDPVLSGWVQERLDARIRHLLIDEFQDTNPLQWQALHAWLSGYAGAGGHRPSVFIVGDPKQSIYRFRRAEPQVFRAAQAFIAQGLDGDLLSCDHTHRNAPAVLALVNEVMGTAQAQGEYEGFRPHTTESVRPGRVGKLPAIPRGAEDVAAQAALADDPLAWRDSLVTPRELPEEKRMALECRQAAAWIAAQLSARLAPRDVMVLARKRDRLSAMQEELRTLGIASQQPEKCELGEAPEVQDIVALLDALVSPTHDLSLARALKSPLFNASDEALVALALLRRESPSASWYDLLQQGRALPAELAGLGERLARWKGWVGQFPPHDALEAIYHDGDVLARFAAAAPPALRETVLANLRAVLGAALQVDGARYATPYALVRALKAGGLQAPAAADADTVRLLTVHGAKGLEAGLVVLLDTDAPPARAETMGVLVEWPGEAAAPVRFAFLASESRPPACTAEALEAEKEARRREELNALYVAMTRAASELVISSAEPHVVAEGSWWQRLQALCEPLQAPALAQPAATPQPGLVPQETGQVTPYMLSVLPSVTPLAQAAAPALEADTPASRLGQAVHRLLELWRPTAGFTPAQRRRVAREFALDERAVEQALATAQRILAGEGAWAWDAAAVDWQGNEVALHYQGELLRLDRLVRHAASGEWWVLDYKSAARPEQQAELLAQMRRYREAVSAAYPGAAVRAAFLTGQGRLVAVE